MKLELYAAVILADSTSTAAMCRGIGLQAQVNVMPRWKLSLLDASYIRLGTGTLLTHLS